MARRSLVTTACFALASISAYSARAQAQPEPSEPTWDPGNPTTSRVQGEVDADDRSSSLDGVYGRFEGDLDIGLGAGVDAGNNETLGALRGSLHYFSTIGIYSGYADSLSDTTDGDRRRVSVGVDIRPAFVPRWSRNLQQGPRFLDLTVDSISLGVGVWWADPPGGSFGDRRGFELSFGLGFPFMGDATGLWLEARGVLRWPDPAQDPGERADGALLAVLSWHQVVLGPLTK